MENFLGKHVCQYTLAPERSTVVPLEFETMLGHVQMLSAEWTGVLV